MRLLQSIPSKLSGYDWEQENKAEIFNYDPVGNRLTGPKPIDYYEYNNGNQLTLDRKDQYEYDHNGNMISKTEIGDEGTVKTWTYRYDYENRLIEVIKQEPDETKTITFKYDSFGRRIEKKAEGNDGTKTYTYVYDNEDIILEYLTKTEDGETRTEITKYVHGPGIDEPLSIDRNGEIYYYHADGLGSVVALTDAKQKIVESYTYTSFGELKRQGNRVKNTYTFTGREWDEETGLYYYRARYYDSRIGRFISEDPIGFKSGDVNFFIYSKNNPTTFRDPLGLKGCGPAGLAIPDSWTFRECCDIHDKCYDKAKCADHDLGIKYNCDWDFCRCLLRKCELFGSNIICTTHALSYCILVIEFGGFRIL